MLLVGVIVDSRVGNVWLRVPESQCVQTRGGGKVPSQMRLTMGLFSASKASGAWEKNVSYVLNSVGRGLVESETLF